jgi:hypothetical protein
MFPTRRGPFEGAGVIGLIEMTSNEALGFVAVCDERGMTATTNAATSHRTFPVFFIEYTPPHFIDTGVRFSAGEN